MEPSDLAVFLLITLVASYIQTVAGFAFGLILVGAASALELAPIGFAAVVVSFTSLINILVALRGRRQQILWPTVTALLAGLLPALVLGIALLDYLGTHATQSLRMLLGATVLAGGLVLMFKPHPYPRPSAPWSLALTGALGGLTGGLFSVSGPPMVFHLYRQPMELAHLRSSLLLVFGVATVGRILLVGVQGEIEGGMLVTSALAAPLVVTATLVGRRYPPPLSEVQLKRFCFLLLAGMGLTLILG